MSESTEHEHEQGHEHPGGEPQDFGDFGDGSDELAEGLAAPRRRRRSPLVDLVVIGLGIYLLATMWGDLRFWLRSAEPRDLGDAAALMEGGLPDDLDESYVTLRGTPDIQHAARLEIGDRVTSYIRIVEGGGSLFAALDRTADRTPNQFEGVYTGRVRRLGKLRMYPWVESFFNAEAIRLRHEAPAASLVAGLTAGGDRLRLRDGEGREFTVGADEPLTLVFAHEDVQLQLGRSSFPSQRAAEAVVAGLGVPFIAATDQSSPTFYRFFARIPEPEREAVAAAINADLELPGRPDASYGVAILPTSSTLLLPPSALEVAGERLVLRVPSGEEQASFGYDLSPAGDRLVPRVPVDGRLEVAVTALRGVSLDRPITVDPTGYLITVGEDPKTQWMAPLMWGAVLLVVGWNALSLVWWWRRRRV